MGFAERHLLTAQKYHVDNYGRPPSPASGDLSLGYHYSLWAKLKALFITTFLPIGYPDTVAPEYAKFQVFDTLQAATSYLRGILATQSLFVGVGVGNAEATALAATMNWILKDGASMFGSLAFSSWGGVRFGNEVRFWRLFADVINDIGLTLDMVAPLVRLLLLLVSLCTALTASLCCVG